MGEDEKVVLRRRLGDQLVGADENLSHQSDRIHRYAGRHFAIRIRAFDVLRNGSGKQGESVSATTVRLLQAASEVVGGDRALAQRLGIAETLLWRFMADKRQLPDTLLLRAVDIILEDRAPADGVTSPAAESRDAWRLSGQS